MSRGRWLLRRSYQLFWGFALFVLVILALYASLGRQYIGLVANYQSDIIKQVELATGLSLRVDGLSARWSGLSPVINLHRLEVGEQQSLILSEGEIELDLIGSVLGISPRARRIEVDTLQIELHQDESGHWSMPGVGVGGSVNEDGLDALISAVLSIRHASLNQLRLLLHYKNGEVQTIRCDDFGLWSDGEFRRIIARINTADDGQLRLIAESYGDPRDERDFNATAYFDVDHARISALSPLLSQDIAQLQSPVSGEFWFSWREEIRLGLVGVVQAPRLDAGVLWHNDEVFDDVSLRFTGSHRDGFWRLSFAEFQAQWRDQVLDIAGLSVRRPELGRWRFELPEIDVAAVTRLLVEGGVINGNLRETFENLSPAGFLRHAQLELIALEPSEVAAGASYDISLRGELENISVKPLHGAPGATGLSGYIEYLDGTGRLLIDSETLGLDFPHVYEETLALQQVRADLRWYIEDRHLRLYSGVINALDKESVLAAKLNLDLPLSSELAAEPLMTLEVGAKDLGLDAHRRYVPYTLSKSLRDWLDHSLKKGHAAEAAFLYRGTLVADNSRDRSIQLRLNLYDAALNFHDDWPLLEANQAELLIDNAIVIARDFSGTRIDGIALHDDLDVKVSPHDGRELLEVVATAEPSYDSVKTLFKTSPLGELTGHFMEKTRGEGKARVNFVLRLPIENGAEPDIDLEAELDMAILQLPDVRLSLNSVRGSLYYRSGKGLFSDSLQALLFDRPLSAKIYQEANDVVVAANARLAMFDVVGWLEQPSLSFFNGDADVAIQLHSAGAEPGIRIRSDMRGVEIQLPQPLFKSREESRSLQISVPWDSSDSALTLNLGETVALAVGLSKETSGLAIRLGSTDLPELQPGLFTLEGKLPFASFNQWQRVIQRFADQSKHSNEQSELKTVLKGIRIDELSILDQSFQDIVLSGESSSENWRLDLAGVALNGQVIVPRDNGQVLQIALQRLYLPVAETVESVELEPGSGSDTDPRRFPAMVVDIDDLRMAGRSYGKLGFDLYSDNRGAHFDDLRGELLGVKLSRSENEISRLHWLRDDYGDRSRLEGVFTTGDLGNVIERLGYPKVLETRSGIFDVALEWPAPPTTLNLQDMNGVIDFRLKEGRFLKTSDTASGALRVLSVFNMANILRRLKFDFRDVFNKGIYFDDMRAELLFGSGKVELIEPLLVEGPSSRFQMTGGIDLLTDTPSMQLIATLPVGSNLPWVAALIGGLPAAAGAYVVSKVFEEQVDSFSSAVYDISGTLQHPEVSFRKIFDANVNRRSFSKAAPKLVEPGQAEPVQAEPIQVEPNHVNK